jgi:DNA-binding NtrC family response regulator
VTALITGESGTGKEMLAQALHRASDRAQGPFIPVNVGALPETLLESELFGHERGAFTSADTRRIGRFEMADRGTLFLDEIGEMPLPAQVNLLRVLEEEQFLRVGGSQKITVDVRIVAATHRNLEEMVREGKFRRDLYYRLKVVQLDVPPLRARREEIPVLARVIAAQAAARHGIHFPGFLKEALDALQVYGP